MLLHGKRRGLIGVNSVVSIFGPKKKFWLGLQNNGTGWIWDDKVWRSPSCTQYSRLMILLLVQRWKMGRIWDDQVLICFPTISPLRHMYSIRLSDRRDNRYSCVQSRNSYKFLVNLWLFAVHRPVRRLGHRQRSAEHERRQESVCIRTAGDRIQHALVISIIIIITIIMKIIVYSCQAFTFWVARQFSTASTGTVG